MKLLNLSKRFLLFIFLLFYFLPLLAEENIDIWNKENFEKKQKISDKKKN